MEGGATAGNNSWPAAATSGLCFGSVAAPFGTGSVAVTGSPGLGSAAATAGAGFGSAVAVEETGLAADVRCRPEQGFAKVVLSGRFGGILTFGNLLTVGLDWVLAGSSAADRFNSWMRLLFMGVARRSVGVHDLLCAAPSLYSSRDRNLGGRVPGGRGTNLV